MKYRIGMGSYKFDTWKILKKQFTVQDLLKIHEHPQFIRQFLTAHDQLTRSLIEDLFGPRHVQKNGIFALQNGFLYAVDYSALNGKFDRVISCLPLEYAEPALDRAIIAQVSAISDMMRESKEAETLPVTPEESWPDTHAKARALDMANYLLRCGHKPHAAVFFCQLIQQCNQRFVRNIIRDSDLVPRPSPCPNQRLYPGDTNWLHVLVNANNISNDQLFISLVRHHYCRFTDVFRAVLTDIRTSKFKPRSSPLRNILTDYWHNDAGLLLHTLNTDDVPESQDHLVEAIRLYHEILDYENDGDLARSMTLLILEIQRRFDSGCPWVSEAMKMLRHQMTTWTDFDHHIEDWLQFHFIGHLIDQGLNPLADPSDSAGFSGSAAFSAWADESAELSRAIATLQSENATHNQEKVDALESQILRTLRCWFWQYLASPESPLMELFDAMKTARDFARANHPNS